MDHFNQLEPDKLERLAILAEECGEVIQIVGKILRHGYDSQNPDAPLAFTNQQLLQHEIGDVLYIIELLIERDDVSKESVEIAKEKKARKIRKYLHHQEMPY